MITKLFSLSLLVLCLAACASPRTQQETLGIWFPNDQYMRDLETPELEREAENGSAEAQLHLGMRLMTGDRVERDEPRAFALFTDLAEAGDPRGAFFLGAAYSAGTGVTKDDSAAVRWYRKSAEAGYDKGQFWYGFMLWTGRGVETGDQAAAVYWYKKAAHQGDANAQFSLREAYESCRGGLPRDFDKASYWYRMAESGGGHVLARYNLRRLIDLGLTEWQEGDPGVTPVDTVPMPPGAYQPCPKGVKDPIAYNFSENANGDAAL